MNNKDILQRFLFENASVRGELVHLNTSYLAIMEQHQYPPVIQRLLGETLAVVVLLSAIIKFKGRLTVQFQGKGKLKLLLAQCDDSFHFRGVAQWDANLSEEDIPNAVNAGTLAIMIDPDTPNGKRYQGIVAWQGESLAQAVEGYFQSSEQLPTRLWLAVNEHGAAGLLLQVMPSEKPELHANTWEHLQYITDTITPQELLELDNQTLLRRLYSQEEMRIFDSLPVAFRCSCSVQRSENAILMLGREDIEEELQGKQSIVVTCEFCSKKYVFDRMDIERIFTDSGQPPSTLH
jgi:molecular chaperone Hsp33